MRICSVALVVLLAITSAAQVATLPPEATASSVHVGGVEQRFLRSYDMHDLDKSNQEERAGEILAAKLDELLKPDKIAAALTDADKLDDMFATWLRDKDLSVAIRARLSKDFAANKHILLPYDAFRTRMAFNQKINDWLDTKTLDGMVDAVQAATKNKYARMEEVFGPLTP